MRRIFPKREAHKRRGEMTRFPEAREPGAFEPAMGYEGLSRLRSEFDRLLDRFFGPGWASSSAPPRGLWGSVPFMGAPWVPSVDLADSDREFTIRAELPGMDPKDINLSIAGGRAVVLSGEKKEDREVKGKAFFRSERHYGSFRRTIPIPAGADPERIRAEYDKGVLVIHIGKSEELKPRKIEVSPPGKKE